MDIRQRILFAVAKCENVRELRNYIANARKQGDAEIEQAAIRRLISLVPSESPGSVEYDFWRTINAFEYALTNERGKTTKLNRTRQKVAKVGVIATLRDWAFKKGSTEGFDMLLAMNMAEYTGEAIVLRHPDKFDAETIKAAKNRLRDAGVDVDNLPTPPKN